MNDNRIMSIEEAVYFVNRAIWRKKFPCWMRLMLWLNNCCWVISKEKSPNHSGCSPSWNGFGSNILMSHVRGRGRMPCSESNMPQRSGGRVGILMITSRGSSYAGCSFLTPFSYQKKRKKRTNLVLFAALQATCRSEFNLYLHLKKHQWQAKYAVS